VAAVSLVLVAAAARVAGDGLGTKRRRLERLLAGLQRHHDRVAVVRGESR